MKWVWVTLLLASRAIAAPVETPRFLIERIDVRNVRFVKPEIIRSELRLPPGHEYTEQQLREASDRINRLPFVLDSEFSLEKGSTRGSYVLVISVAETKPLFYALTADATFLHLDNAWNELKSLRTETATVGARTFLGSHHEVHLAVAQSDSASSDPPPSVEAGYTRYGILGSSAFAQVNFQSRTFRGRWFVLPDVLVGVPLGARSTLTVDYSTIRINAKFHFFPFPDARIDESTKTLQSTLAYNTTNAPFFPTDGVILSVTPAITWDRSFSEGEALFFEDRSKQEGLALQATRYWPLSNASSIATSAAADLTRVSSNLPVLPPVDQQRVTADIGWLHSLRGAKREAGSGDMGFEFHVQVLTLHVSSRSTESKVGATASFVRRNAWGTLRIGASYTPLGIASPLPAQPVPQPGPHAVELPRSSK